MMTHGGAEGAWSMVLKGMIILGEEKETNNCADPYFFFFFCGPVLLSPVWLQTSTKMKMKGIFQNLYSLYLQNQNTGYHRRKAYHT